MRLFIAIKLSEELQSSITSTMHSLKKAGVKGSYVPSGNLHLTMAFIGEVQDRSPVQEALQNVHFKPFRLSLSEMGNFGDILWIGLKGNQGLSGLARDIRSALDAAEIPYDRSKFVPHITIIRKAAGKWKTVPAPKGEMMVRKVSLMKSEQKDGKRVYTEIFSIGG